MKLQNPVAFFAALGTGLLIAGCSGGRAGSPGSRVTNCEIVWAGPGATSSEQSVYVVDAPVASWTDGTHAYGDANAAIFYDGYDASNGTYLSRTLVTDGTYTVAVEDGTNAGGRVSLVDLGGHALGGFAIFHGRWSDPATPLERTPGESGNFVDLTVGGSTQRIEAASFGLCYNAEPTAP